MKILRTDLEDFGYVKYNDVYPSNAVCFYAKKIKIVKINNPEDDEYMIKAELLNVAGEYRWLFKVQYITKSGKVFNTEIYDWDGYPENAERTSIEILLDIEIFFKTQYDLSKMLLL